MTKITRIAYGSLDAALFLTVFQQVAQRAAQLSVKHSGWTAIEQQLQRAVAQLDQNYKKSTRNDLTADISAADTERDVAMDNLLGILRAFAKTGDTNAVQALEVAERYGFRSTMQMDAESTLIHQMQQEFQTRHISFAALGCDALWQRALSATARLDQLLVQRDDSRAGQTVGQLRIDRDAVAAAWQSLIEYVEALQVIAPEQQVAEWVVSLNAYLDRVRKQMTHQTTSGTVADGSVNIDADAEPTEPVTPPAEDETPSGTGTGTGGTDAPEFDA